jgi:hypothetical protein
LVPPRSGPDETPLVDFKLLFKRLYSYRGSRKSYAMARCPSRQDLDTRITALFRNEAGESEALPTTAIKGTAVFPCTAGP